MTFLKRHGLGTSRYPEGKKKMKRVSSTENTTLRNHLLRKPEQSPQLEISKNKITQPVGQCQKLNRTNHLPFQIISLPYSHFTFLSLSALKAPFIFALALCQVKFQINFEATFVKHEIYLALSLRIFFLKLS